MDDDDERERVDRSNQIESNQIESNGMEPNRMEPNRTTTTMTTTTRCEGVSRVDANDARERARARRFTPEVDARRRPHLRRRSSIAISTTTTKMRTNEDAIGKSASEENDRTLGASESVSESVGEVFAGYVCHSIEV